MKKIFVFILSAGITAGIGTISISCAPTQAPQGYDGKLIAAPSTINLTQTDSLKTSGIALFCGCTFDTLRVTGYGGDTTNIRFSCADTAISINEHTLQAEIYPSKLTGHDTVTAWIAISFNDTNTPFGTMLYDTIRVTANY